MHFLLVNDDGIGAKGIMALYHAAVKRGHTVSMCAPSRQQSAASHRITIQDPIFVEPFKLDVAGCEGFSIGGSPADCVRLGMKSLVTKPVDLVISGINDGYNAGIAVHYSGTVGAAKEGTFHNLPAIAASIHHKASQTMLNWFADWTVAVAEEYVHVQTPANTFLNINAPKREPSELLAPVYVPLSEAHFVDCYEKRTSPRGRDYFWMTENDILSDIEEGTDVACLKEGHITLTMVGNCLDAGKQLLEGLHIV